MMQIDWTDSARRDLRAIHSYISKESALNADRFTARLVLSVDRLEMFPDSGRALDDSEAEREIIFQNYRIIYEHSEGVVRILAVIHGARDFQDKKLRSWEK